MSRALPGLGSTPKTRAGALQLYDRWAESYDATVTRWGYTAPRRAAELLRAYRRGGQVLDAGCGTGLTGLELHRLGFQVLGVDLSAEMIKRCSEKAIYRSLSRWDLEVSQGPLPFKRDEVQAVLCIGVLSYVCRFEAVFAEWCRVAEPLGHVVFSHRDVLWDNDVHGCRSAADALVRQGRWRRLACSPPERYMPLGP